MFGAPGLPATVCEHAHTWFNLKQSLFVRRWFKAIAVRPGIRRQRLRVTAGKQGVRFECFRLEDAAYLREKLPGGVFGYILDRGSPA